MSGSKEDVTIDELIRDLKVKSEHITSHILENEILTTKKGLRFFNGHYDNLENKIGGEKNGSIMMDLTSQVIPIISNVTALPESDPIILRKNLIDQVTGTVRWRETMELAISLGIEKIIELGSGKVLTGIAKRMINHISAESYEKPEDFQNLN